MPYSCNGCRNPVYLHAPDALLLREKKQPYTLTFASWYTDFTAYTENAMNAIREGSVDMVLLHPSAMTLIYENGWVGDCLADVSQSPLFQQYSSAMRYLVTGADGTAYGYPSFMSFAGLLVNTDLLAECGVTEIPSTASA